MAFGSLRAAFDRVERGIGEPLENRLNTSGAAYLLLTLGRLSRLAVDQMEAARGRAVHLFALPSHHDVKLLSARIARLQRAIRELQEQIDELHEREAGPM